MSRKRRATKRELAADVKFNSILVSKFVNKIMMHGKKTIAEAIVYDAFDILQKKLSKEPLEIFETSISNIKPDVEVKSRRIGGATYQIPVNVPAERQVSLALNWIIAFAKSKKSKPMAERLATEIMDGFNSTGAAIKKKEDTHKMAEANRAFAHFRW